MKKGRAAHPYNAAIARCRSTTSEQEQTHTAKKQATDTSSKSSPQHHPIGHVNKHRLVRTDCTQVRKADRSRVSCYTVPNQADIFQGFVRANELSHSCGQPERILARGSQTR